MNNLHCASIIVLWRDFKSPPEYLSNTRKSYRWPKTVSCALNEVFKMYAPNCPWQIGLNNKRMYPDAVEHDHCWRDGSLISGPKCVTTRWEGLLACFIYYPIDSDSRFPLKMCAIFSVNSYRAWKRPIGSQFYGGEFIKWKGCHFGENNSLNLWI